MSQGHILSKEYVFWQLPSGNSKVPRRGFIIYKGFMIPQFITLAPVPFNSTNSVLNDDSVAGDDFADFFIQGEWFYFWSLLWEYAGFIHTFLVLWDGRLSRIACRDVFIDEKKVGTGERFWLASLIRIRLEIYDLVFSILWVNVLLLTVAILLS